MAVSHSQRQSRLWIILAVILVIGIAAGSVYLVLGGFPIGSDPSRARATVPGVAGATATRQAGATPSATSPAVLETGLVTTITAASSINQSGPVAALQLRSVFWKINGTVAQVLVQPGAHVQRGDVLMRLDPLTAPGSVIQAESELLSAQAALDELQHPSALDLANANIAVLTAQDALSKAQRDLHSAQNPVGTNLQDAVDRAKLALDTARANQLLGPGGGDSQALTQAITNVNNLFMVTQKWQAQWDQGDHSDATFQALQAANAAYQAALNVKAGLELRNSTTSTQLDQAVKDAQAAYDAAVNNLNAGLKGPNPASVSLAQFKLDAAQASLTEVQKKLANIQAGGAPGDIKAAQARIQIAQASVEQLELRAPIDGDVLAVSFQPGDDASPSQSAVDLANRSAYHVDVAVDETGVSSLAPGDTASVTFASLPDLALTGSVKTIGAAGHIVQGVVQYDVQVEIPNSDPRVRLGMTANVSIVTAAHPALAVPLAAIQRDSLGEFVNRVGPGNVLERVAIISGAVAGDRVLVQGNLQAGDKVQVVKLNPATSSAP